jgi:hypothetical protein
MLLISKRKKANSNHCYHAAREAFSKLLAMISGLGEGSRNAARTTLV